jgi:hypothetical protein
MYNSSPSNAVDMMFVLKILDPPPGRVPLNEKIA